MLNRYERDGIVFPIKVFSAEEAGRFRTEIESVVDDCGTGPLRRLDSLHLFFDWAYKLVTHRALLDTIEGLLGTELLIDGTLVFYKPPHDSSYVSWHHLTPSY
jgi:hypothetical protein